MGVFLGIDTSNYTTSLSLYDPDTNRVEMEKTAAAGEVGAVRLASIRCGVFACEAVGRVGPNPVCPYRCFAGRDRL